MSVCRIREIDGYEIGFIWGNFDAWSMEMKPNGIVLIPGKGELSDPQYIAAINTAFRMLPAAENLYDVLMEAQSPHTLPRKRWDDGALEVGRSKCVDALNQTYWEIDDKDRAIITSHLKSIEGEIEKRQQAKQSRRRVSERLRNDEMANWRAGYVYLIQSPTGAYKIGRTSNPDDRMKTFSVKLPFEVEYVCLIPTPDMYGFEAQLHDHFASKRVNGEWFALDTDDVEYIKGLAS